MVSPEMALPQEWLRAVPADFFPASPESARIFPGENGWIRMHFSDSLPAGPSSLEKIRSAGDLPPGVVLWRPMDRRISFTASVPFGLDVHWLKEVAEGVLRGTTGVRVHSAGKAALRAEWSNDWAVGVARESVNGTDGLRVVVAGRGSRALVAGAEGSWEIRAGAASMANPREVAAALLGIHPLQQARALLKDLGSKRVEEFVASAGATLRAFDAVRAFWQQLGCRAEAGLRSLLTAADSWEPFVSFLQAVAADDDPAAPGFDTWLERAAVHLPGDLAAAAVDVLQDLAADGAGGGRWRAAAQRFLRLLENGGAVGVLRALAALPEPGHESACGSWVQETVAELFGPLAPSAAEIVRQWGAFVERWTAAAALGVERQLRLRLAAGISTGRLETAVADATFRFTEEGLNAAAHVAQGDLSPVFAGGPHLLRLRRGLLTESFCRRCFLELHAPMLRARRKQRDLASFASAEAQATGDGRIQVLYSARAADALSADLHSQSALIFSTALSVCDGEARRDHFSLSYTDRRRLDPAAPQEAYLRVLEAYGLQSVRLPDEPCTAVLSLHLPGTLAEAWMRTPPPGAAEYLPAMSRAAHAVQSMARRWLPALYLARVEAYCRPSAVHPLLAWSCSPPGSGPRKKDLSYDFMDPKVIDEVLQASAPAFRERLEQTWRFLMEAGRRQTAAYYEPADTRYILANVRRQQRNFVSLLTADAFLVEAVLNLADGAREVDRLARVAPKAAVKEMARFAREMAETFHRKLRRLYAGEEFLALGPLFFLSATSALAGAQGCPADIAAVLTLEWRGNKASYANEAARRLL
jgi:hypothetical protein